MTHTVATLDVPRELYELVRTKLLAAGYAHAIDDDEKIIDMTGIGLTPAGDTADLFAGGH